jgi:hypothetical protein
MLGRKSYEPEELAVAKATIDKQLAAYRKLAKAVSASGDAKAEQALEEFEPAFFNALLLALDRPFVHRVRMVTGKDGNALNEVELLVDSLMAGGEFRGNNVIRYEPADALLGLEPGDRVALTRAEFERVYKAFLGEIESKFL